MKYTSIAGGEVEVTHYDLPENHAGGESFCIIMLPDSQNYVKDENNLHCFEGQINWIFANRERLGIKFVTHVGDISNDDEDEAQFKRGFWTLGKLNGAVPWGICAGNHDMSADGSAPYFEKYFPPSVGDHRSDWIGSYDGNKHNAQKVTINGKDHIFIHLAYIPSDGAVEWAKKIIEANPTAYVTITTHAFLICDWSEKGIARRESRVSLSDARMHKDGTNAGEQIFEKLVKPYDNVRMVLNGHYVGRLYRELKIGERRVHAILADLEHEKPYGGNGFLRIIQFVPSEGKIYNYTYSPTLDAYKLGEYDSFVLDLNY